MHTIALPEADRKCPCCNEPLHKFGEECSEQLDYTPAVLKGIETRRENHACNKHEESGVPTPPVPVHPIEKGMATAGLISHVLVAKYKDHLPPYRQSSIFARHGAEIAESTLCDWVKDGTELLRPVVTSMKTSVLESHVVQSDDAGITLLDKDAPNGSRRGFLWAYVGDRNEVVFDFTVGRGRDGPRNFLGDSRRRHVTAVVRHAHAVGLAVADAQAVRRIDEVAVGHAAMMQRNRWRGERAAAAAAIRAARR